MDKLNSMSLFVAVVKQGSFTRAAEKTNLSRAQISKSLIQLEAELGVRLLHRTTRKLSLTESGSIYFDRCLSILEDVAAAEAVISSADETPSGTLMLTAPTSFGILHLKNLIPNFLVRYPDVQIRLSLNDRQIDLVEEGFDLAIRISDLRDSSLVSRRIAPCKRVYCASPNYLAKHGKPEKPEDLVRHQCLVYTNDMRPGRWVFEGHKQSDLVKVTGPLCSDNGDLLKSAALNGLGITCLPMFIVGPEIKSGRLEPVLANFSPPDISIYALYPSRKFLSAKVRAFVDFLVSHFGEASEW